MDLFLDIWVISKSIEPGRIGQFPEPRHLTFCIAARIALHFVQGDRLAASPQMEIKGLFVAYRFEGLRGRSDAGVQDTGDLVYQTVFPHLLAAVVQFTDQRLARWAESDLYEPKTLQVVMFRSQQVAHWPLCADAHFKRTDQFVQIVLMDPPGVN